ncbi:MAG TPA: glycosyltransferase family 39 protein [Candidatus Saccharimonadales bacterium]|nr:glycosyltransferase family 39 protein [Candidatus Saccharimonadales bacterium]
MKFLTKLEKNIEVWFLLIISFVFFLLRLPSLFEPLWYGDEGIYEVIGIGLNHGRLLYRDIWDNKPPLLYVLYAIVQSDQPVIRFVSLLFGLASVILFYFLVKKLFLKSRTLYVSTSIFTFLLAIPLLEGNIANAENFIMPLILGSGLLIINLQKNHTKNGNFFILFCSGLLLGLAFLFKVVAIFDLAAFTLFLIVQIKTINIKQMKIIFFELIPLYVGVIIPVLITLLFFALHHALPDFIHSAFLSNVGYVSYGNQFHILGVQIPQGLLLLKLIILGLFCAVLFTKRAKISPTTQFILLWLAFSIFSALFSQRPYTHYLLVLLTSSCLCIGILLQKTKSQFLSIGIFFLMAMYFLTNFSFYNKNIGYYRNFLAFVTNNEDTTTYRAFFDGSTPRDYALADFLKTKLQSNDQVFLWGNNAQLYALVNKLPAGKYIVAYWINSSRQTIMETQMALHKQNPRFIIIMPNAGPIPYSLKGYSQRLIINYAVIYEKSL